MKKEDAIAFYEEIINREDSIKEIKDEIAEAINSFASSNNLSVDGVKKAIKEHKDYKKDPAKFLVVDADADKVFDAMVGKED